MMIFMLIFRRLLPPKVLLHLCRTPLRGSVLLKGKRNFRWLLLLMWVVFANVHNLVTR